MAINTEPHNLLRADVTRQLLLQRSLPHGQLRESIEASWLRSLDAGLDCQTQLEADSFSRSDVRDLHENNKLLLDCAAPEVELLTRQYSAENALIMLADCDARILAVKGNSDVLDNAARHALNPGVCWSESSRGTNALGTALVDGRAVKIEGSEHFLDRLTQFSCTSAPIFGPNGNTLGVLDLTSERGRVQQPLEVVQMAARSIENRLFSASFKDHAVIAIHSRQQYLSSVWQGLIAVDPDGDLLGANQQAHQLLNIQDGMLKKHSLDEMLGISASQLLGQLMQGKTYTLQTRMGALYCCLIQLPKPRISLPFATEQRIKRSGEEKRPGLAEVAGNNPRLSRSLKMALKGMAHDLPVLLNGETGTGKEVVARALHDVGARSNKPFIAVNCAAIPEGLIESELFGYREGAFTGSRRGGMVGRFQQADGGTLFLDEIGDMPLALQARLLRVLQERRVAPLGGGEEVSLDIRLICATHRDMRTLVAEGGFREDLFYRLNGVGVKLPALRERTDLPEFLTKLLASVQNQMIGTHTTIAIDSNLMDRFSHYSWPGNIRQMETVLRASLAFMDEDESLITEAHLTDDFLDQLLLEADGQGSAGILKQSEHQTIRKALDEHGGNISATAKALGISRATLYRRLQELEQEG